METRVDYENNKYYPQTYYFGEWVTIIDGKDGRYYLVPHKTNLYYVASKELANSIAEGYKNQASNKDDIL